MLDRLRSLRAQVLLVVAAVVVMTPLFAWIGGVFASGAAQRMEQESRSSAESIAQLIREKATSLWPPDAQLSSEIEAVARRYLVRVRVLSPDATVLFEHDCDAHTSLSDRVGALFFGPAGAPSLRTYEALQPALSQRPEIQQAWRSRSASGCDVPVGEKAPLRLMLICHAALRVDGSASGLPLLVLTEKSERRTVRAIHDLRYQLLKLTVLVLMLGGLLGWWLGWRMVRPIEALREQVLQRTAGPSSTLPIMLRRRDEFEDLARAFNALLQTLAERSRSNEAFVADLVHEMKNPVAAIRACADSMDSDGPIDKARAQRLSRVLRDSSRRLETLVTWFLDLARAEAGLPNEERTIVDVHELLCGLMDSLRSGERYAKVRFTLRGETSIVHGVAGRLESALSNLLDNAASFAGENGEVVVQVDGSAEQIEIVIQDSGPGIAAADLPKIFERFFTTRAKQQGTGLGLPMARAIIEAHSGTLTAASAAGQGAIFTARLPRFRAA